jgi:hypothetical protein
MPAGLSQYTRCAQPGNEMSFPGWQLLVTFISVGGVLGFIAWAVFNSMNEPVPCGVFFLAAIFGLITALHYTRRWYYEWRLMCIKHDQCAVGTIVGIPYESCDGDRKIDMLIAPFGFREVDTIMMSHAIQTLAAADPAFPPPPADLDTNRGARVAYVYGLDEQKRKRVYQEIVHNDMFGPLQPPGRDFQSRYYRREAPPVMPQDAFDHTPSDVIGDPDSNPMFKYQGPPGPPDLSDQFCSIVLGFEENHPEENRLTPFLHNEIEGNRIDLGIAALQAALFMAAVGYIVACQICVYLGGGWLCTLIAGAAAALIFFIFFLLFRWLFGVDEAGADDVPLDVPDPTATDPNSTMATGDVVMTFGDWIKDTEHGEYFEIHPVKAYYVICRNAAGMPEAGDDVSVDCEFDVTTLTKADVERMCGMMKGVELHDPPGAIMMTTPAALSMSGGIR